MLGPFGSVLLQTCDLTPNARVGNLAATDATWSKSCPHGFFADFECLQSCTGIPATGSTVESSQGLAVCRFLSAELRTCNTSKVVGIACTQGSVRAKWATLDFIVSVK